MDNGDHDDGAEQCHQHGWNIDRIVDSSDMEKWAEEVTREECAHDAHDNVDQEVGSVAHDLTRNPADHCRNDQVYEDVHFALLWEHASCTEFTLFLVPCPLTPSKQGAVEHAPRSFADDGSGLPFQLGFVLRHALVDFVGRMLTGIAVPLL